MGKGIRTPVPADGLVLGSGTPMAQIELVVQQEGDKNLVFSNIRGALQEMLAFYDGQTTGLLPMSEVHVLNGFYLEGYVTLSGTSATCGQPIHLPELQIAQ